MKHCLKCRKNTKNINPRVSKTSNGRTMVLSKCAMCGSKKSRFIKNQEAKGLLRNLGIKTPLSKVKNQEAKGLLRNLGIKTPLSKVPILGDILF